MKHAIFNEHGLPQAFYAAEIHGDAIPADTVEITDEQWQEFIDNQGLRRWSDGTVVTFEPPATEPDEHVAIVFPADLWRRATDEEAEAIDHAMGAQPLRIRRIFTSALEYRSDDDMWPLLMGAATQLFGEERAAELLAPS